MLGFADTAKDQLRVTSRRDEVLELVAKRRSLKQVATELGISESTVNYHIRALKELHRVNTLAQLADVYVSQRELTAQTDCRNSARSESAVSQILPAMEGPIPDNGEPLITFNDAMDFKFDAPWTADCEPSVVPGVLDGTNAGVYRGVAIIAIAVGMLALILLGLGVAQGITAALSGVGATPVGTV
jgi:DNA-binding CsgD family transcriptional regulator